MPPDSDQDTSPPFYLEPSPSEYDSEWIISRSPPLIQHKVRELIEYVETNLPEECRVVCSPWRSNVQYRGEHCATIGIGQKLMNLAITHRRWVPPVQITLKTNLNTSEFRSEVFERFQRTWERIDLYLERKRR